MKILKECKDLHSILRKEKFKDRRVRKALSYAFDFEWSNKNFFLMLIKEQIVFLKIQN